MCVGSLYVCVCDFQEVAARWNAANPAAIPVTSEHCRAKIKRLKMSYHKERRRRAKSGAGGESSFPFFEKLDEILGCRPISRVGGTFSSIEYEASVSDTNESDSEGKLRYICPA